MRLRLGLGTITGFSHERRSIRSKKEAWMGFKDKACVWLQMQRDERGSIGHGEGGRYLDR